MEDLPIGTWVEFFRTVDVGYHGDEDRRAKRTAKRVPCGLVRGQIVGLRTRHLGLYESGGVYGEFDCDQAFLDVKERIRVYLVAVNGDPKKLPVEVLPEDIRVLEYPNA